jgi:hypothetical protein
MRNTILTFVLLSRLALAATEIAPSPATCKMSDKLSDKGLACPTTIIFLAGRPETACMAGSTGCGDNAEARLLIADQAEMCRQKGYPCLIAIEINPEKNLYRSLCGPAEVKAKADGKK